MGALIWVYVLIWSVIGCAFGLALAPFWHRMSRGRRFGTAVLISLAFWAGTFAVSRDSSGEVYVPYVNWLAAFAVCGTFLTAHFVSQARMRRRP